MDFVPKVLPMRYWLASRRMPLAAKRVSRERSDICFVVDVAGKVLLVNLT